MEIQEQNFHGLKAILAAFVQLGIVTTQKLTTCCSTKFNIEPPSFFFNYVNDMHSSAFSSSHPRPNILMFVDRNLFNGTRSYFFNTLDENLSLINEWCTMVHNKLSLNADKTKYTHFFFEYGKLPKFYSGQKII